MRPRTQHSVVDVGKRELGQLPNRSFSHRFSASEDLLRRFGLHRKLKKHRGCVNTVSFNADGNILVSGSHDRQIILWDWQTGSVKISFSSGHCNHISQAQFMPFSDDRSIITSAADGQVRHAKILESGGVETSVLGRHQGQVHKLAVEPGSSFSFYTCGEDGVVKHFDLRTRVATNLFTCKDAKFKLVVYLNAIAVDLRNPNLFAVGGMDEYARVYDIRSYRSDGWYNFGQPVEHFCPRHLIGDDQVGITGLAFSHQSELVASYNDEFIYLFARDMALGSNPHFPPSPSPQVYKGHKNRETVKGVNFFGPMSEYVVTGSDCGRIFIWRKKDGELIRAMEADKHVVNCVESHPHMPLLCSSGIETDIKIWTPEGTEKATSPENTNQASNSSHSRWFRFSGFSDEEEEGYLYNSLGFCVDDDDDEEEDGVTDDEDSGESSYDDDDDDDDDGEGDDYEEETANIDVDFNKIDDDCDIHNDSACGHNDVNMAADDDDDGDNVVEDEVDVGVNGHKVDDNDAYGNSKYDDS